MTAEPDHTDTLLATCDAVFREVAGYPVTPERLQAAMPLLRGFLTEIRRLDEVDVDGVEPAVVLRRER